MGDSMSDKIKIIIAFVIGLIVAGSIGVYAAIYLQASDIRYDDTTVDQALNNLYIKADKPILKQFSFIMRSGSSSTTKYGLTDFNFPGTVADNYKYFKVTKVEKNNNGNTCTLRAYSIDKSNWLSIDTNTEYEILSDTDEYNYRAVDVLTYSYQENQFATCTVHIILYNK